MKNSKNTDVSDKEKRHELRKELKLLKLNNMKLKKQLRLSMRVRFLNRSRLEGEINQLNTILLGLKSKFLNDQQESSDSNSFVNPESFNYIDSVEENAAEKENVNDSEKELAISAPTKKTNLEFKFYCDRCNFKSQRKAPFDIHMRRHTGDKPFSCDVCKKGFVAKYELKLHRAKHSNSKEYSCDLCEYKTYRPDMLVNHMEKHSSIKGFSCNLCDFNTNERCVLISHIKESHGENFNCSACDEMKRYIASKKEIKQSADDHLEIEKFQKSLHHTCGKPHMCKFCGTSFKKQETLTKHIRTHTGERPYKCDRCDYAAAIKNTLIIHKRIHTGQKPYACDQCSYRCTTRSYLKIHLNQHKGIKPFACDQCDYRSVDSCKLLAHRKVRHNEDRPFSCEFCPFKAKLKSRLKLHTRIHGLRPFVCPHCAKSFTIRRALIEHEGIHNGNQPYTCEICKEEKRFTLKSTYKMHKARHLLKYACDKCEYKTSLRKDLFRHLIVHENEMYRPRRKFDKCLQCSFCKFKCAQGTTLYKHIKANHPNESSDFPPFQEVITEQNDQIIETYENCPDNLIPTPDMNATSSTPIYPIVTPQPISHSILNVPTSQMVPMEANPQNTSLFVYNKEYSHNTQEYSTFTYKSDIVAPATVEDYNSLSYKNHHISPLTSMVHAIANTIHKCDQCEYSVADPHKLFAHRKIHLTDNNLYTSRFFK